MNTKSETKDFQSHSRNTVLSDVSSEQDFNFFIDYISETLDFCLKNGNFIEKDLEHVYSAINNSFISLDIFKKSRQKIFCEIQEERERQNEKWGIQNHHPMEWFAILSEETGAVAKEIVELTFSENEDVIKKRLENYRTELIQVSAVAVQMIECLDRNRR